MGTIEIRATRVGSPGEKDVIVALARLAALRALVEIASAGAETAGWYEAACFDHDDDDGDAAHLQLCARLEKEAMDLLDARGLGVASRALLAVADQAKTGAG